MTYDSVDALPVRRIKLASVRAKVTPMRATEVVSWLMHPGDRRRLLVNHNLHSVYMALTNLDFARLYGMADRTVIDGAPVLWLARRAAKYKLGSEFRVGSTDWIEVLSHTPGPGSLAIYGASEKANDAAVDVLGQRMRGNGWKVAGLNGYVPAESAVHWLNDVNPTIVLVGLGMPLQEQFLLENWENLPPAAYATVGGAIDYSGGSNRLAPRWLGRLGLEWAWRFAHEPKRLWYR